MSRINSSPNTYIKARWDQVPDELKREYTCPICLESESSNERIMYYHLAPKRKISSVANEALSANKDIVGHMYHSDCIKNCQRKSGHTLCPICRQAFASPDTLTTERQILFNQIKAIATLVSKGLILAGTGAAMAYIAPTWSSFADEPLEAFQKCAGVLSIPGSLYLAHTFSKEIKSALPTLTHNARVMLQALLTLYLLFLFKQILNKSEEKFSIWESPFKKPLDMVLTYIILVVVSNAIDVAILIATSIKDRVKLKFEDFLLQGD